LFSDLLEAEKKLDWTLSRKRQEVKDATSKDLTVGGIGCPISAKANWLVQCKRTLRLFLSHSVQNQPWQRMAAGDGSEPAVNFETGEGVPSWTFQIQGKLLDVSLRLWFPSFLIALSIAA
jgi:SWI/SNF-related matrix-associated actin-dependent regulator of chromatin subfamily D